MNRVLVIGGTLFIGRALVRLLLDRGDEVTILHRSNRNPFVGRTQEIRCDRNDGAAIAKALSGREFELVFDNVYDWERGTTAAHIEAAAAACGPGLRRYVFLSSCAAYGSGLDLSEDAPLAPPDFADLYCRNKADSERLLFRLHRDRGFPAVTLRPPYVYGPENPFYREVFFWERLTAGRPIVVPGDGSRSMQFILSKDLARAAVLTAEAPAAIGRAYNIANAEPVTQTALVHALAKAAGVDPEIRYVSRNRIEALGGNVFASPLYFGQYFDMPPITENTARSRCDLGFEPTPFSEGLRQTWEWHVSQPHRTAPDFSFDEKLLGYSSSIPNKPADRLSNAPMMDER